MLENSKFAFGQTIKSAEFRDISKSIIYIIGMGRTGSSLLSRLLSLAGCQFPGPALAAAPDNPDGFWEPLEVLDINERYLSAHASSWHDSSLRSFDAPDRAAQAALEHAIAAFFERHGDLDQMVIKEPRTVMTASTWFAGAEAAGYQVSVVIPVRHPGAVIASLLARDPISASHAARLWMKYSILSEYQSRGYPQVFIDYDNVISDWQHEIERVKRAFLLPNLNVNTVDYTPFVKPRLRHHIGLVDIIPQDDLDCMAVYAELKKAAHGSPYDRGRLDLARHQYRHSLDTCAAQG